MNTLIKQNTLHIDFETRSEVDIKLVGALKYAAHPSTEILCMAYAYNDEPVQIVHHNCQVTADFQKYMGEVATGKCMLVAFNAFFERNAFKFLAPRSNIFERLWCPDLAEPQYWQCTMAQSSMCGLTGNLDNVCTLLGMKEGKDKEGKRVMMKMTKPRKPRKAEIEEHKENGWHYDKNNNVFIDEAGHCVKLWHETPEDFEKLYKYCKQDVVVERRIHKRLPRISVPEQALWQIDQRINGTGVSVDMPRVNKAIHIMDEQKRKANTKIKYLTGFRVGKITQVAQLKKELVRICEDHYWTTGNIIHGKMTFDSLDAQHLDDLLKTDIPDKAKELLLLRKNNGKSSTAKYEAIRNREFQGKVHGLFRFHHATTGRWGSTGIQLHNLPRGNIKDIETARFAFDNDAFWLFPPVSNLLSCLIRSMLIAEEGFELCVADYSAIEARVLNWLAGQHDVVKRFEQNAKIYLEMAKVIYQNPDLTEKDNPIERWVGKQTELGSGFMMGWKRFREQCAGYGQIVSVELAQKAIKAYRKSHPKVVKLWYGVERMIKNAIQNKDQVYHCKGIYAKFSKSFLRVKLLSGRLLYYYKPRIDKDNNIRFWGYDSQLHRVVEQYTYGGKMVENIVQGIARDIMAHAIKAIEGSKYKTILHVHDEICSLVKEGEGDIDEFCDMVTDLPAWANGCPTKAEGWLGKYYKKD